MTSAMSDLKGRQHVYYFLRRGRSAAVARQDTQLQHRISANERWQSTSLQGQRIQNQDSLQIMVEVFYPDGELIGMGSLDEMALDNKVLLTNNFPVIWMYEKLASLKVCKQLPIHSNSRISEERAGTSKSSTE